MGAYKRPPFFPLKKIGMIMKTQMEYKGFSAAIMEAERLVGDQVFGLPPGSALPVYYADEFQAWPKFWMKGPGVFLVPVRPNKGLWFNWTSNMANNTAIIPTVKGCNPITGLQTSGFHLERYADKCPKHGNDFKADRFCSECNYKWPAQSYVSHGYLWWDGFRSDDGSVRQFFFTEDELRDVATHMIGKENTVPAFGFAFYRPKQPREVLSNTYRGIAASPIYLCNSAIGSKTYSSTQFKYLAPPSEGWDVEKLSESSVFYNSSECKTSGTRLAASFSVPTSATDADFDVTAPTMKRAELKMRAMSKGRGQSLSIPEEIKPVKEVAIGAGAKIQQELVQDPFELYSWKDTPDAVMTIYFVFQEKFEELKAGGMKDVQGSPEGMLAKVPVG